MVRMESKIFTFIELMSIILPSMQRAKSAGVRVVCLNNLRQVNLGFMEYVERCQQYFPPYDSGSYARWPVKISGRCYPNSSEWSYKLNQNSI